MAPLRLLALAATAAAFVLPAPKPSTILRSQVEDKVDAKGDGTMLYNVKGPTNTAKSDDEEGLPWCCLLYTSPSPRDRQKSRMPSSA